jgi:hypothetical protein
MPPLIDEISAVYSGLISKIAQGVYQELQFAGFGSPSQIRIKQAALKQKMSFCMRGKTK